MTTDETDKTKEELIGIESNDSWSIELVEQFADDERVLEKEINELGSEFYPKLLFTLTSNVYSPDEAARLWKNIGNHRRDLNKKLERDVGLNVATLDYLRNIAGTMSSSMIIEENKMDKVAELATKDELTNLYVRSFFDISLKKELEESIRYQNAFSLMMMDIDDFKPINDTYGHQKGDEVLSSIGAIINARIRESDIAGRYGGEELAIILPQTSKHSAYNIAERIRRDVENRYKKDIGVTVSIGIADYPPDGRNVADLIKTADNRLYEAKEKGKNRTVIQGMG